MKILEKVLSDTDSIYCQKPTSSHQSSIFIAQTNSDVATSLFGRDYESNMPVVVEFSKTNLLFNILFHFLEHVEYYKRGSEEKWIFDKGWFRDLQQDLNNGFGPQEFAQFHVSVNKETSRTYIKGLTSVVCAGGISSLDLRRFLFSGDILKMMRRNDGVIVVAVADRGGEHPILTTKDNRAAFINWLCVEEKKAKKTVDNYLRALDVVSDPFPVGTDGSSRTTEKWPGVYEYLTSKRPRNIYQIDSVEVLQTEYVAFYSLFANNPSCDELPKDRYDACRLWAEKDNHRTLKYAFLGYERFLEWRKAQKPPEVEPQLPPAVDRLSIALKLFAEKRKETGDDGWFESGLRVNAKIRKYFEPLTVDALKDFDKGKFEEFFLGVKNSEGKIVFNPMWSGGVNKGWNHIKQSIDDSLQNVVDTLVSYKTNHTIESEFLQNGFVHPKGFGPAVISELLMKFHPDKCFKHGPKVNTSLNWLGMIDFKYESSYSDADYKQVCGAAAKILGKMIDMKLPRQINEDGSEDSSKPDYLTVNEFIYFVDTNKDLIMEEVMSNTLKKDKPTPYEGKKDLELKSESKDDELLLRLLASLRAKPFAILAGHSGTGKSRYVKKLAYMTCNAEELRVENQLPGNYLLLQVKPNWHDSTDLLGFRNAMVGGAYQKTQLIEFIFKAYHFSETPFFLCLDEMNLAPVEQYFAEFLSAMESKEPVPLNDISEKDDNLLELGCEWEDSLEYLKNNGFSIPNNLFIVGTVNMDETTNQFSRKVLDRAFTIEMTDVDFTNYGNVTDPSYGDTIKEELIAQLLDGEKAVKELDGDDTKEDSSLVKVQKALASTPFAIAYRFANEYTLLKRAIECFDADGKIKLDALDQAVLMKILPRIAGERDYIEKVYGEKENEGLRGALEGKQVSLSKISEILKRAKDTNSLHITFWP